MTAVILLTPILDILSGVLQEHRLVGADRGAGSADPDPAVRLAGGRARGDLLVPDLLQAADRCHHAARVARGPRDRRRHDRVRARRRGVRADRDHRGRAGGPHRAGPGLARARGRSTLLAGLIATPITIVFSYYLAIVTYRFGLDPDNQTVPIITSVMDLAGVACVLFVMSVSGVLPHG